MQKFGYVPDHFDCTVMCLIRKQFLFIIIFGFIHRIKLGINKLKNIEWHRFISWLKPETKRRKRWIDAQMRDYIYLKGDKYLFSMII